MIDAPDPGRETERHAEDLKRQLASAFAATDGLIQESDGDFVGEAGRYLDFEALPEQPLPNLSWPSKGILLASASRSEEGATQGTIFVPDRAQAVSGGEARRVSQPARQDRAAVASGPVRGDRASPRRPA